MLSLGKCAVSLCIYIYMYIPQTTPAWWGSYYYVHKWVDVAGFSVAGGRSLAVAGGFGGRWPWLWLADSVAGGRGCGCGWSAWVQMRCVWLGLEL